MKNICIITLLFLVAVQVCSQSNDENVIPWSESNHGQISNSIDNNNLELELENLYDSSVGGDAESMYFLGISLARNLHGIKDWKEAIYWLERSVQLNNILAIIELAKIYKFGINTDVDFNKAYEYFSKAADLNSPYGLYMKGYMLYKGFGCVQNYEKAFNILSKGAKLDSYGCMYILGICYRNGFGVSADRSKAEFWLNQAAANGFGLADFELEKNEPEYLPNALTLLNQIRAVEKLANVEQYPINEFSRIVHYNNTELTPGIYEGFQLKYDWSGTHILEVRPISFEQRIDRKCIAGLWQYLDTKEEYIIDGLIEKEEEEEVFKQIDFLFKDHYHEDMVVNTLKDVDFISVKDNNDVLLRGNLFFFVPKLYEPQKPISFILKRQEKLVELNGNNKLISSISGFPNPTRNRFNVKFSILEKASVQVLLRSSDGKLMFSSNESQLSQGEYVYPYSLEGKKSGSYFVSIFLNGIIQETIKVVKI